MFILRTLITLLILSVNLVGCSSLVVNPHDPASLMSEVEAEIHSAHYQIAIDKLRAIQTKFPYSNHSIEAQLRIADIYFMQDSYIEAAAAYEVFRELHPTHPRIHYVLLQIGKSYLKETPTQIARDLSTAQKALDAYKDFLKQFPEYPEAAEARRDILSLRNLLAKKELSIGNFYFKRGNDLGAAVRYNNILRHYSETAAAEEARTQLGLLEQRRK